jgi:hypothetical protein
MKDILKQVAEWFTPATLAGFGGLARSIVGRQKNEPYNWKIGLGEIIIAMFAGITVHLMLTEMNIPESCKSAAVAMAGYSAREILNILRAIAIKRLKKETKE